MTDQQSYILGIISELDNISEEYYINIYPYPLTLANIMNGSSSFGEGVEKLAAFNRFAHYY